MSIKQKLGMALGMEDDAPNVQVNIDTDEGGMPLDEVAPIEDSNEFEPTVAADAEELNEDANEIAEDDEDLDGLAQSNESLVAVYLAMESAQQNGGLTPEAATFAAISVESILVDYNVKARDMGISLESFGDNKARATTVSMESVMSALQDIWDAIVRKFKEMIKKIADFYQKTIAAAPRIKRRAEALKKKAQKTTGSPKETKIKTGLFGQLNIAGSVPASVAAIETSLKNSGISFTKNMAKDDLVKSIKDIFNADTFNSTTGFEAVKTKMDSLKFGSDVTRDDLGTGTGFTGLLGNKVVFISKFAPRGVGTPGTDVSYISGMATAWKYGVYDDATGVKNDKDKRDSEFKVLTIQEVESLCNIIIGNMQEIINFKTQANRTFDEAKVIEKEGDKLISKIANKGEGKAKGADEAMARSYLSAMASMHRKAQSGNAAILRYQYNTSKAVLAYCARSLSQYRD